MNMKWGLSTLGLGMNSECKKCRVEEDGGLAPLRACAAESDAYVTLELAGSSVPNATIVSLSTDACSESNRGAFDVWG